MNLKGMISQMQMGMPDGPAATASPAKPKASPVSHLSTALAHAKAGKHHEAKQHALKAVNALHRLGGAAPAPSGPTAAPAAPAAP